MADNPYIIWFQDCDKSCSLSVGGKNASLGEMTRAGIHVPPGFAVTTAAYRDFVNRTGLAAQIKNIVESLNIHDIETVEEASRTIRQMMGSTEIPAEIEDAVVNAYEKLCSICAVPDLPAAVRSSATAEDLPDASFAGQQDTSLWVCGASRILIRTAICWSSLFTPRAIVYRKDMGFNHEKILISVGIQKMANARTAGVMFTINPTNGDRSKVTIDASWGLGESVVSGEVTPDNFLVDKVTLDIVRRQISAKLVEYIPDPNARRAHQREVTPERQNIPCLSDEEVVALTKLGKHIEHHYGAPQDIEWAIDHDLPFPDNVFVLQSRPETVWSQRSPSPISGNHSTGVEGVLASLLVPVRVRPPKDSEEE